MYYSIIDFTTSKENQSVLKVFEKEEIKKYKKVYKSHSDKNEEIFRKTMFILKVRG